MTCEEKTSESYSYKENVNNNGEKSTNLDLKNNQCLKDKNNTENSLEIKLLEYRFNQVLGEMFINNEINDEENQSYIITVLQLTENGNYLIAGDKGGRIIVFEESIQRNYSSPKFNYLYEYSAFDKDFDIHKSIEYSESIRAMCSLPAYNHNTLNIISCGYRSIRLDRVYISKVKSYETNSTNENLLTVPKVCNTRYITTNKCKNLIKIENSSEINSINYNKYFMNQLISSDDKKVLLWDLTNTKLAYNIIDLDEICANVNDTNRGFSEHITKSTTSNSNPHIFAFGTNQGKIKICDTRTSSNGLLMYSGSTSFLDEFKNITDSGFNLTKTAFSMQIMSVHDLLFKTDNYLTSRHCLSVNTWDLRNDKVPVTKFLVYEPVISKLSHLYKNNQLGRDKFSLSSDSLGKLILTGGYNNMFHIFDLDQRLNTQITIDTTDEKILNTNIIRRINSKGSCFYKKTDSSNIKFDRKILKNCYSEKDNFVALAIDNCIYTYSGKIIKKATNIKS